MQNDAENKILSNLTALNNYMNLRAESINKIFNYDIDNKLNDIYQLDRNIRDFTSFNIETIAFIHILNNDLELNKYLDTTADLYNISSIAPYNLSGGAPLFLSDPYPFPLTLLAFLDPPYFAPGLPTVGTVNMASITNIFAYSNLYNFPDRSFDISPVSNIFRVDGTILNGVYMTTVNRPFLVSLLFEPQLFLSNLLTPDINSRLKIEISDSKGIFYTNNELSTSDVNVVKNINFINGFWNIKYSLLESEVEEIKTDNNTYIIIFGVITACLVTIGIIIILVIIDVKNKNVLLQESLKNAQTVECIRAGNSIMLHEIKNINNIGYAIVQNKETNEELTDREIDLLKKSVHHTVRLTANILDFEKILLHKYEPKEDSVEYIEMVKSVITQAGIRAKLSYDKLHHIIIDKIKMMELFSNGFTNAIKHKNSQDLEVIIKQVPTLGNKLLTQIINYVDDDFDINFDNLFIPFYIKNATNKDIWKPVVDIILTKNDQLVKDLIPHLDDTKLPYQERLTGDSSIISEFPSTGLGLSISKMISHVLGGDCGIYYQSSKKKVIFWFLFNYETDILVPV